MTVEFSEECRKALDELGKAVEDYAKARARLKFLISKITGYPATLPIASLVSSYRRGRVEFRDKMVCRRGTDECVDFNTLMSAIDEYYSTRSRVNELLKLVLYECLR